MEPITVAIDVGKCRTRRVAGTDAYWCLSCNENQQTCPYAMRFGTSLICRHPARIGFAEHPDLHLMY
jgi:hypothetical protein